MEVLFEHFYAFVNNVRFNLFGQWYLFALIAVVAYGLYQYFLDGVVESRCTDYAKALWSRASVSHSGSDDSTVDAAIEVTRRSVRPMVSTLLLGSSSLTVTLFTGVYLIVNLLRGEIYGNIELALFLGTMQGLLFLFSGLFKFEARKKYPNSVVLPVTRTSVLIVILASWYLFDEIDSVSSQRLVGFVLIGMSIFLFRGSKKGSQLSSDPPERERKKSPVPIAVLALTLATLISASMSLLSKYAVGPTGLNIFLFMFVSNLATSLVALIMMRVHRQRALGQEVKQVGVTSSLLDQARKTLGHGLILGALNLLAFAAFLHALSLYDASVIIPIYSLNIVIPVVLSTVLKGEKLLMTTTVGVVLSIAAVIILQ